LADYLVQKGIPFRKAHHSVGALVALAEGKGKTLDQLTLDELRSVEAKFGPDARKIFDLNHALSRRTMVGATGTREVRKQLAKWRKILAE
jgi:argininosuccinate lyase